MDQSESALGARLSKRQPVIDWSSEFVTLTEVGPNLGAHTPTYIGQSEDLAHFEGRKAAHAAQYPDAAFNYEILESNLLKSDLDRYEQFYISTYGGPTLPSGKFVGDLSNKRNQMAWWRYALAGGDRGIP